MRLIDTHQHLWDPELFSYGWTKGEPRLNKPFRTEEYRQATEGIEVLQSVFVEADVDPEHMVGEAKYVLSLAERDDNPLAGVVAAARPESDKFADHMAAIAGHQALKGIRRLIQSIPAEIVITKTFIDNLRTLEKFDLSFDICAKAHQLPQVIEMVRACPGVRFILDHCGNPEIKEGVSQLWRDSIVELASFTNVDCKISGIVVNADHENWTADDLRQPIEWTIQSFGWDRVIFGSDWPVCTLAAPLRLWVETLDNITTLAGEENRRKLFIDNARRVYRL